MVRLTQLRGHLLTPVFASDAGRGKFVIQCSLQLVTLAQKLIAFLQLDSTSPRNEHLVLISNRTLGLRRDFIFRFVPRLRRAAARKSERNVSNSCA